MVPEEKLLEIEIEAGMVDGQEVAFIAEGLCLLRFMCSIYIAYIYIAFINTNKIN